MESFARFHDRSIKEIIPESQSELLARILPVAIAIKEGQEIEEGALTEFSYLVKIWRDREVLWAQYPAGLLACKTIGDLVEYLYKRHQSIEQERGSAGARSYRMSARGRNSLLSMHSSGMGTVREGGSCAP